MDEKNNLDKLKENYKILQEKYSLPSFEKLNEDFQIEKIAEFETELLLKETRRFLTDKFFNYLRFVESILNPVNVPMFVFAITKTLGISEREKLGELYKIISKIEVDLIELDLQYSEEKETEAIKKYYDLWQEMKKDFLEIVEVIRKNWDSKTEEGKRDYFR